MLVGSLPATLSKFITMNQEACEDEALRRKGLQWVTPAHSLWACPVTAMSSPWNPPAASNFTAPSSTQSGVLPIGAAPLRTPATNKTMTAAMFAQTKFGSTKLKTQAKRSNRLSPTENFSRSEYSQPSAAGHVYGSIYPAFHPL